MSEFGGLESFSPDEGNGGGNEQMSEEARQRFAGAAAALQQIRKEEKQSKKRDQGVAQVILQFLTDTQRAHLATLISRLVSRDCPSPFILAILSLISPECRSVVQEYLKDALNGQEETVQARQRDLILGTELDSATNAQMMEWITRMELVLASDSDAILRALIVDDANIDGTILQLTTFVLQEFLQSHNKDVPFDTLQPLAAGILQSLFKPHLEALSTRRLSEETKAQED